jgi:hypothetical protein
MTAPHGLHPFFPMVTLVLNSMGFGMTWYLYRHILPDPVLAPHQDMFKVPIGFAFVFGIPLALWMAKRRLRYPLYVFVAQAVALVLFLKYLK